MDHYCVVHHLGEAAHALGHQARPPFEVLVGNGTAPHGGDGDSHDGVVKLDELVGVFEFVDAVDKEGRNFDLVFDAGVIKDDVVCAIDCEGDTSYVGT